MNLTIPSIGLGYKITLNTFNRQNTNISQSNGVLMDDCSIKAITWLFNIMYLQIKKEIHTALSELTLVCVLVPLRFNRPCIKTVIREMTDYAIVP